MDTLHLYTNCCARLDGIDKIGFKHRIHFGIGFLLAVEVEGFRVSVQRLQRLLREGDLTICELRPSLMLFHDSGCGNA